MATMVGCSACGKTVAQAQAFCPHCGAQNSQALAPTKKGGWRNIILAFVGIVLVSWVGCLYLAVSMSPSTSTAPGPSNTPAAKPTEPDPELEHLSSRGYESSTSYHTVEGEVRNIGGRSLDGIRVVVRWYTKDDTFISSDQAMLDYDPLLPGQSSPYKTISRTNPAMSTYTVEFARRGSRLAVKDSRKGLTKVRPN